MNSQEQIQLRMALQKREAKKEISRAGASRFHTLSPASQPVLKAAWKL
jgi:hypothetical protein